MADTLYTSRSSLQKIKTHDRFGTLETGDRVEYGLHGAMAAHYKLTFENARPFPVDYIVNATGS